MPAAPAPRPLALPPLHFPDELPIAQHRDRISELIRAHPVTIVCGETGSGKTTQIPKICLASGRGERGLIGCTQPRRIAARSLAHRLAQELPGTPRGFVGHKIRFQDATRPETVIKVMTDGVLLAETHSDRKLRAYDTVIVDEAHERSLNIDFLLGYLRRLVEQRPDLRIVVTSATSARVSSTKRGGSASPPPYCRCTYPPGTPAPKAAMRAATISSCRKRASSTSREVVQRSDGRNRSRRWWNRSLETPAGGPRAMTSNACAGPGRNLHPRAVGERRRFATIQAYGGILRWRTSARAGRSPRRLPR